MVRKQKEKSSIEPGAVDAPSANAHTKPTQQISLLGIEFGESIEMFAISFDLIILFNHLMAYYFTITTIYRTRPHLLPEWFGPTLNVSSAILAKYLVCRCFRKSEYKIIQTMISNKAFSFNNVFQTFKTNMLVIRIFVSILVIYSFFNGLIQMSFYFNYKVLLSVSLLPIIVSLIVFNTWIPPIPDIFGESYTEIGNNRKPHKSSKEKSSTEVVGVLSNEFMSLSLAYIAFRVGEALLFTSVLPILLIEDHYLYFDSTSCSLIAGYVATSTTILLTASALFLNRKLLIFECQQVGYWKYLGNVINYDDAIPWSSDYIHLDNKATSNTENTLNISHTVDIHGYPKGILVSYKESVWESYGNEVTRCIPGDYMAWFSYSTIYQDGPIDSSDLKKSKLFFGCIVAKLCLLSFQLLIISSSFVWVPFAQLLLCSLSGMVRF